MLWLALGYGFALGAAQFYLIKALFRLALVQQQGLRGLRWPTALGLLVYVAAALAAVYLFEDRLVPVAAGLGIGLAVCGAIWLARKVRKLKNGK